MIIEQTVEIPPNRQLFINVPVEVPVGKTRISFSPFSEFRDIEYAEHIWMKNHSSLEETRAKLQKLHGSLGETAFGGLDGVTYQRKLREEWEN